MLNLKGNLSVQALLLGGVSALAIGAGIAPAVAQDSGGPQTITVTGLRGSLQRALDVKKNSVGVVDAVSSEDIGKFPDSNLATAMQRIPGVSVSRGVSSLGSTGAGTTTGDATEVTVRGFGPQFNVTLVNGRQLASGRRRRRSGWFCHRPRVRLQLVGGGFRQSDLDHQDAGPDPVRAAPSVRRSTSSFRIRWIVPDSMPRPRSRVQRTRMKAK